MAKAR
jgi:hypothetical protein